jgi:hypothetical protein
MNKIILLFLLIYNKTNTFIENVIQQEYSLICEEKNSSCEYVHSVYNECGSTLFNIWLSLDLLLSVSINDYDDYNIFYNYLEDTMQMIKNKIIKIKEENNKKHILDNKKLFFYIQKIMGHSIIKYNESLLSIMKECKEKIIEILVENTL